MTRKKILIIGFQKASMKLFYDSLNFLLNRRYKETFYKGPDFKKKIITLKGPKNKKYEFLHWDCELGDAVIFDMRTLHGSLGEKIPDKTLSRYTLRVAKEDSKISYDGDWTSFNYRKAMQDAGYKNGDPVDGKMFPTLFEKNN